MKGFFLILFLVAPFFALADGGVVINEIAWMGTKESSSNEWIELANNSQNEQDISGWKLETQDGKMRIILEGKIPAGGFFLLERTDDMTVPEIKADQIYTGSLSNSGEVLLLMDKNGIDSDRVDASKGWTEGGNTSKQTMQRRESGWFSAEPTPRAENVSLKSEILNQKSETNPNIQILNPKQDDTQDPLNTPNAQTPIIDNAPVQDASVKPEVSVSVVREYPKSVYISEFLPDPEGSDGKGEWIELYNNFESAANIGGFFLDDGEGGSKPYKIPDDTIISSKGFIVFNREDTNMALNNKNDEVRLLYPDGSIAAKIAYQDAPEGQAAAFDGETKELHWTNNATPGKSNILSEKASSAGISKEKAIGQYQEARVGHIGDLPPMNLKELGRENENFAASAGGVKWYRDDFWIILIALFIGIGGALGYLKFIKKIQFLIVIGFFFFIPYFAFAEIFNVLGEHTIDGKSQVDAEAVASGKWSIIYLEKGITVRALSLEKIVKEFDEQIYPNLTALLGEPWTPGIDNDSRITILIMKMPQNIGGYYNDEDEVSKAINPTSNEREILYVNSKYIEDEKIQAFLAHEFSHAISFNQKIRRLGVKEDVWFNEARAEYAPTFLGYDHSILDQRVDFFLTQPHDHLITWNNTAYDYGAVNMFSQYLVSRFGSKFFSEEMKTKQMGIPSVNLTLNIFDPALTFAKFFSQWRLANYLNDDSLLNGKYSYKNSKITFTFSPEIEVSFPPGNQPVETFITTVPTFSAKAITFLPQGNNLSTTFSTSNPSDDLVVTYIKEFSGGRAEEGQFTLEKGEGMIQSNKETRKITALVSNASAKIIQPRITVTSEIKEVAPSIRSVESVFLKPSLRQNVFSIEGDNFEKETKLFLNGKEAEFTYRSSREVLAKIPLNEGDIEIKAVNPGGAEAVFLLKNPLLSSAQLSLAMSSVPLIRASNDYKVYVFQNAFKRHIPDAAIFSFYGHLKNASIAVISPKDINSYTASNLIRRAGDYKVYEVLPNGKKQWIKTSQEFETRGFDWNAIFEVNERELTFYPTV